MRTFLLSLLIAFVALPLQAQNPNVIDWINTHAIEIENAHPDSALHAFGQREPETFSQARIFGFGEATHQTKEFFDIKAKFFKYLVVHHGVRAFLMEESYGAEAGINEWISGGDGSVNTIAQHFSIGSWYAREIVDLLLWMRNYNAGKPEEHQIRFYGIDIQTVEGINKDIRFFVEKHQIPIDEALLQAADSSANPQFMARPPAPGWAARQIPMLRRLEQQALQAQKDIAPGMKEEYKTIIRILNSLISYTEFVQNYESIVRDKGMFENAKRIIDHEIQGGKAFIWAHNQHINKKELSPFGSGWTNLGGHLKNHYKDMYYSVGFDFGGGTVASYVSKTKQMEPIALDKPFRNSYAEILDQAHHDLYFIDLHEAIKSESAQFFCTKKRQLNLGGPGYVKGRSLIDVIYAESYDAILFVKTVSLANTKLQY